MIYSTIFLIIFIIILTWNFLCIHRLFQFFNFNGNLIFNWIYFSLSLFFLPSDLFISSSVATQLYFFLNRYYSFPQIYYLIQSINFIFHFLVAARLLSGTFDFLLLFSYDFWNFIHLLIKIPNFLFISSFFASHFSIWRCSLWRVECLIWINFLNWSKFWICYSLPCACGSDSGSKNRFSLIQFELLAKEPLNMRKVLNGWVVAHRYQMLHWSVTICKFSCFPSPSSESWMIQFVHTACLLLQLFRIAQIIRW